MRKGKLIFAIATWAWALLVVGMWARSYFSCDGVHAMHGIDPDVAARVRYDTR